MIRASIIFLCSDGVVPADGVVTMSTVAMSPWQGKKIGLRNGSRVEQVQVRGALAGDVRDVPFVCPEEFCGCRFIDESRAALRASERMDITVRKEILWESDVATDSEVRAKEIELIVATGANDPAVGYNKTPRYRP